MQHALAIAQIVPVVLIHTAAYDRCLLGGLAQVPRSADGHILPAEAPPALCEHEQVEPRAVLLVIALKVPAGLGHKATYLAGQEHLGEDGAVVVQEVAPAVVPHGERHAAGSLGCLQPQVHRLIGGIGLLEPLHGEAGLQVAVTAHKEEAVGIDTSVGVEYGELEDARRGQGRCIEGGHALACPTSETRQRLEGDQAPLVHEGECQTVGRELGRCAYGGPPAGALLLEVQRHALRVGIGQAAFGHRAVSGHEAHLLCLASHGGDHKGAAPTVLHPGRVLATIEPAIGPLAIAPGGLESHAAGQTRHQASALGKDREGERATVHVLAEVAALAPERHIAGEDAWLLRTVIHGEDTAVEFLVVAEIGFLKLPRVEPPYGEG